MEFINRKSECDNDFDGVLQMQDLTGQAQLTSSPVDDSFSVNFDGDEQMSFAEGDEFSNAGGVKRFFKNRRVVKAKKQAIKAARVKGNASAKNLKAQAKVLGAKAQGMAAKAMGKNDPALAAALSAPAPEIVPVKAGMSTGVKIGIGVGVVALIAGAIFAVKHFSKK